MVDGYGKMSEMEIQRKKTEKKERKIVQVS